MKKILLVSLCGLMFSFSAMAQNDASYATAEKLIAKAEAGVAKKATDPKAWITRADAFSKAYDAVLGQLRIGMSPTEVNLFFKQPTSKEQAKAGGKDCEAWVYPNVTLYIDESGVIAWKETKEIAGGNALGEVLSSLKKAAELDNGGANAKGIAERLSTLNANYESEGFVAIQLGDANKAMKAFSNILVSNEISGTVDTLSFVYAGMAAQMAGDNTKALEYMDKAIDLKVNDPYAYQVEKEIFLAQNNTDKAIEVLQKGMTNIGSEDQTLLLELIDLYISVDKNTEALEYLEKAKVGNSDNALFPFVQANLYDKIGDYETALKYYDESIALRPDYFDAYFNKGISFYNRAIKIFQAAQDEEDNAKYNAMQDEAKALLEKAVEPMEKAASLDNTSTLPLDVLKTVYFRLQRQDDWNRVNNLLTNMQ